MEMREWYAFEQEPWRADAACVGYPTSWWYPERGHSADTARKARRICARCPVQSECLQHALEQYGRIPRESNADRSNTRRHS